MEPTYAALPHEDDRGVGTRAAVFLPDPGRPRHGHDVMKAARPPSGTSYPMPARLREQGLVESEREEPRVDANGAAAAQVPPPDRRNPPGSGERGPVNTRGRVLRLSGRLLRRACLRLPEEPGDERYRGGRRRSRRSRATRMRGPRWSAGPVPCRSRWTSDAPSARSHLHGRRGRLRPPQRLVHPFVFPAGAIAGTVTVSVAPGWFLHRDSRRQRSREEGPGGEGRDGRSHAGAALTGLPAGGGAFVGIVTAADQLHLTA